MSYYLNALKILKKLNDNHYEAYIVGGFVRDRLFNIKTHDIDITTSATPIDITELFKVIDKSGSKYGSVKIKYEGFEYEITTFRLDILYTDNRHPEIIFTKDLNLDIKRRDFTINALLIDKEERIIDLIEGVNDLNSQVIRTIGVPSTRFQEDSLRILRAFYLVSKLGFEIEKNTYSAIKENIDLLKNLSFTRVNDELSKILRQKHQLKAFKLILETNVIKYIPKTKKAIMHLLANNLTVNDPTLFYCLAFYLEGFSDFYKFSKNYYSKLNKIVMLADICRDNNYNKLILYSYGLDVCLYASRLNKILYNNDSLDEYIISEYNNLPIKKTCDLKFKGQDIISLTNNSNNLSFISTVMDIIKYEVLMNQLENDYERIKEFVIKNNLLKDEENEV